MKSSGSASHTNGDGGEEVYTLGDVIWVKPRGNSWWPAQVVDEKAVSGYLKPHSRTEGKILVRLYGSYKYFYADPVKSRSEFDIVLKQNNGCCREIFEKSLEQDRLGLKSDKSSSKRKEVAERSCSSDEDGNDKTPGHKRRPSTANEAASARKVRVMQRLGLVAPPGSPFKTNRHSDR